jgi:hypothetical protein
MEEHPINFKNPEVQAITRLIVAQVRQIQSEICRQIKVAGQPDDTSLDIAHGETQVQPPVVDSDLLGRWKQERSSDLASLMRAVVRSLEPRTEHHAELINLLTQRLG